MRFTTAIATSSSPYDASLQVDMLDIGNQSLDITVAPQHAVRWRGDNFWFDLG